MTLYVRAQRLEHWKHFAWFTVRINRLYTYRWLCSLSVCGSGHVRTAAVKDNSIKYNIFKAKISFLVAHLSISTVTLAKLYYPRYVVQNWGVIYKRSYEFFGRFTTWNLCIHVLIVSWVIAIGNSLLWSCLRNPTPCYTDTECMARN